MRTIPNYPEERIVKFALAEAALLVTWTYVLQCTTVHTAKNFSIDRLELAKYVQHGEKIVHMIVFQPYIEYVNGHEWGCSCFEWFRATF